MIVRTLAEDSRRARSRRVITEAMRAHRTAIEEGHDLLYANTLLMEFATKGSGEGSDIFGQALKVVATAAMGRVIRPVIEEILNDMGLQSHPKVRSLFENIIETTFTNMVSKVASGDESLSSMWNCEELSDELAKSAAEAIPKTIFDELFGRSDVSGIALTIREGIADYFRDQKTVKMIADKIKEVVCKTDLSAMFQSVSNSIRKEIG